jgi:MFS transporter, CP family, cyanate transporter
VLLAAAAVFGSMLVARVGARRGLLLGLVVVALASAGRGIGPSVWVLFAMTFLMGVGIAVSQPALPSLVRQWFPQRVGMATAVYSNGFLIGEIAATSLTVPLILPLVAHSWELDLLFWSFPVLATAIAIAVLTRHETREPTSVPMKWWPDWRSGRTWRLGLVLGCASTAYFGSNAFLPDYLKAVHHAELIPIGLATLNIGQLPSSILAGVFADRLIARRWPIAVAGVLMLVALVGYKAGGTWLVMSAGMLGFSTALVFVLSLALPPLLTHADDVHRLSAAMFTISYMLPFVASFVGGAAWDASSVPFAAFAPIAAAGLLMLLLLAGLDLTGATTTQLAMDVERPQISAEPGG